jgi:uncharacterized membrane protein
MKLSLFVIGLLFILTSTSASAAPLIQVDHPTYNFGTILQGKKLDYTFVITNAGDVPLKILHIRPACGCTAANASTPLIQPGKTAEIKATFNSANFFGTVTKTIAVETNDPKTPVYTLSLTGTITEEIVITPKQLNLGQVKAEVARSFTLNIENRGGKPLKLTSLKTPMPQVTLKSDKTQLKPGETATLSVTVTPRQEDRMLSGYLSLTTDNPTKPEIMIPVYGSLAK